MAIASVVGRLVGFLRAGHPGDIAPFGYTPLLALLPRRLSQDDVVAAAADLGARGSAPIEEIDIRVAITKITGELASDVDTGRIKNLLVSRGFSVSQRHGLSHP